MLSILENIYLSAPRLRPLVVSSVRNFSPRTFPMDDGTFRGDMPRKYGYEPHHHTKGLLPRLKLKEKRLATMPVSGKEDYWSKRQARMGENDFIKIFGDEEIEQHELLTHIPDWLRGYKKTNFEYQVLLRQKKEFEYWRYTKPQKWLHIEQRIKFLYRRLNNKYKPPEIDLVGKSRHLL